MAMGGRLWDTNELSLRFSRLKNPCTSKGISQSFNKNETLHA
ncbi:hypothetical protein ABI_07620 [Asticcacaulis biprosthecium C19]|uniref:Uncharacterized protein n=1 Tax=Asticcacaulis biprosthecium C19 TaxID=715226 RepID=F4QLQ8_9CAUL|nr:hypothetical protein ABI_07620 [Asticcacaulis biprosthecium C19]